MSNQSETVIAKKMCWSGLYKKEINCVRKFKPNMAYLKCDEDDEAEEHIWTVIVQFNQMTMDVRDLSLYLSKEYGKKIIGYALLSR